MPKLTKEKYPDLEELFVLKLQGLYDMEEQLVIGLEAMAKAATDLELKQAFKDHMEQTEAQVKRLEEAFTSMDVKLKPAKNEGARGMIKDTEWKIKNLSVGTVRDAALVAAAMEVEHHEMASYTAVIEWAALLGFDDIQALLEETLEEEEESADILMALGTEKIFQEALGEEENTEDGEVDDEELEEDEEEEKP